MFSIGAAILPGQQPVAKAGINGSQILFSCHSPMGRVIIKGENQHGNNVTWQGEGQPSEVYVSQVFTQGWWWKGWVVIDWYDKNVGKWYSNNLYVEPVWSDDTFYLGCSHGSV